jgi:hypothetical protein
MEEVSKLSFDMPKSLLHQLLALAQEKNITLDEMTVLLLEEAASRAFESLPRAKPQSPGLKNDD